MRAACVRPMLFAATRHSLTSESRESLSRLHATRHAWRIARATSVLTCVHAGLLRSQVACKGCVETAAMR